MEVQQKVLEQTLAQLLQLQSQWVQQPKLVSQFELVVDFRINKYTFHHCTCVSLAFFSNALNRDRRETAIGVINNISDMIAILLKISNSACRSAYRKKVPIAFNGNHQIPKEIFEAIRIADHSLVSSIFENSLQCANNKIALQ